MSAASNLSLYKIEIELLQLVREREEIASDPDMTPQEQADSLAVTDDRIREYVCREIVKVDGIAAYLRECEAREAVIKKEIARLRDQADLWIQRHARLEAVTLRVMQQTGATQLDGANSTFKVRKNPPSVDVAQPELVPTPYQRLTVKLNRGLWERVLAHLMMSEKGAPLFHELIEINVGNPEPMKAEIGKELKAGVGVPGCRLVDDKVRLVVE